MSRKAPVAGPTISLFPFLAVLLCTMGALLVLLVLFSRSAKQGETAETAEAAREREQLVQELELARDSLAWRREQLAGVRERTAEDLAKARMQLAGVEENTRALQDELTKLERTAAALASRAGAVVADEETLRGLEARLTSARESLDKARATRDTKPPAYAVVPYAGRNGTHRRPLYIECCGDGVFMQPEGIRLSPGDFEGPPGPGNPLASALRAAREHIVAAQGGTGDPAAQPYPLLLVRPSGVMAYYAAREAIQSWGSDFGYQLIDEDWTLTFPPADPMLAQVERRAIEESRARLAWLAEVRPTRPAKPTRQYRAAPTRGGVVADGGPSVLGDQSRWDWSKGQQGGGAAGGSGSGAGGSGPGAGGSGPGAGGSGPGAGSVAGGSVGSQDAAGDAILGGGGGDRGQFGGQGTAAGGGKADAAVVGDRYSAGSRFAANAGAGAGPGGGAASGGLAAAGTGTVTGAEFNAASAGGSTSGKGGAGAAGGRSGAQGMSAGGSSGGSNASGGSNQVGSNQGGGGAAGGGSGPAMPGLVQSGGNGGGQAGAAGGASASTSLAQSRGSNWASLATQDRPIPLTRPIRLECSLHEFRLLDDTGRRVETRIPVPGDTAEAIDPLVAAVHARVNRWGIAGERMYWKPQLVLSETADGRSRREDLERLLADSGLDTRSSDSRDEIRPLPPVERAASFVPAR